MAATSYLDIDQLKDVLNIRTGTLDDALQLAIDSASRQIDEYCNDQFWLEAAPVARLFRPDYARSLFVGSFLDTASTTIQLDADDDGVFETTLAANDWQAEPIDRRPGWPYNQIETLGAIFFPGSMRDPFFGYGYGFTNTIWGYGPNGYPRSQRARVKVIARWGWPTVPVQVQQACQILAIDHYKSKDITNGAAGSAGLSVTAFGGHSEAKVTLAGFNPMARSLLCGLRDVVIA